MSYIYKGSRHRQSGTTMQKCKPPSAQARHDEPRKVLPGYPKGPFTTLEDVEAYTSGDRVACLLCGKTYRILLVHVRRIHELDEGDYRLRFNIPVRFPLSGTETREKKRVHYDQVRDRLLENVVERTRNRRPARYRQPCEFGKQARIANLPNKGCQ